MFEGGLHAPSPPPRRSARSPSGEMGAENDLVDGTAAAHAAL